MRNILYEDWFITLELVNDDNAVMDGVSINGMVFYAMLGGDYGVISEQAGKYIARKINEDIENGLRLFDKYMEFFNARYNVDK